MEAPLKKSGIMLIFVAILVSATVLSGCVTNQQDAGTVPTTGAGQPQSLSVTGSTTVLPIAQLAAESYMDQNQNADIQVSGGGSSVGVQAVGEGTADIGMSSRDLKAEEKQKYPNLVTHVIANDGIAIVVHPSNSVTTLTMAEIRGIYNGTYTNWNQVGGSNAAIVVVGRDSASGTREFFHEKVMAKENFTPAQLEKNSNGAVKQTIAQTPGAIGYVGLGYLDDTVQGVQVGAAGAAVEPTVENILNGRYPISRPLILITRGEPTGLAKDYIDFILSDEGQQLVQDEGFVPV